jgi:ATP-dependent DNA helicase RecG
MEITELLEIISRGEDSKHEFKKNFINHDSFAQEMVAFSNSGGGQIFVGVNDDGTIAGLTFKDMVRINKSLSAVAEGKVRPPINPQTENIALSDGLVMIITIPDGISKPYMTNEGYILVKSGADKRRPTSREEIQRMFQSAGLIHGDEIPANGTTVADVDLAYFKNFFEREYGEKLDNQNIPLPDIFKNMNLLKDGILNISGALLFVKSPQIKLPIFIIKAISYPDNMIDESEYLDSQDITGKLADVFQKSLSFVIGNLKRVQGDRNINVSGEPEIPKETLEELLANALIHRDYFISAPIRVFVFRNRVEIISPGYLPNNLTIENIKSGNSNIRNPILASYATKILPYRGLGTGIRRALQKYPEIDFKNDLDGNQFKVIIKRRKRK